MRIKVMILLLYSIFVIIACKHELPLPGIDENPGVSNSCSPDSIYFINTILPVINGSCASSGCHDPASHEEDLVLNNYSGIMRIVRAGNATESELYQVIRSNNPEDIMPPPPHQPLSADHIAAIQKWINQGAKNNQCLAACDTTTFTYSGEVLPIINTYCKGCHNPSSPGGGIDLSIYGNIKAVGASGKLMGSIRQLPGFKAMPQGTNKLSDCQIRQIGRWIEAGMPDN